MLPVWSPFWSIGFHRALLGLVHAELAATGLRHSFDAAGTATVRASGRDTLLDLRALTHAVAARPLREWPDLVADEVTRHVAAAQAAARFCAQPPSAGDAVGLLAVTLCADTTPRPGRRVLAEGLAADLAYDLPTGVTAVPEQHLASWGDDPDGLWAAATNNTRIRVRAVLAQSGQQYGSYDVVAHPSPFTASVVLCMDELAGPVTPYGVVFGAPSRCELVAHVVTAPDPAAEALRDLPDGIRRRHARVAAPLSPRLYCWRDGQVTAVPPGADAAELTGDLVRTP